MKKLLLIQCYLILISTVLKAQFEVQGYLDMGETLVSEGFYSQLSGIGSFEQRKWGVQGGAQLGLIQPQDVIFNSWYASPYAKLKIGNTPLVLGGEYLWTGIRPTRPEIL